MKIKTTRTLQRLHFEVRSRILEFSGLVGWWNGGWKKKMKGEENFKLIIGHSPRSLHGKKCTAKQPSNITKAGDIKTTMATDTSSLPT